MDFFYDGKEISTMVEVTDTVFVDSAAGALDSVELTFSDTQGLWSSWEPKTGIRVSLSQGIFNSGECFVDQLGQKRGLYLLRALSAPAACKQPHSRSWEKVSLLQLAADLADNYSFAVKSYGVENHTYERLDQCGISDLELLNEICGREGYALKVSDRSFVIYNEAAMEQSGMPKAVDKQQFCGAPDFSLAEQVYGSCAVSYGAISHTFSSGEGGDTLYVNDIYLSSMDEATRFAKGLLRKANRKREVLSGSVELDLSLAAGSLVDVTGVGTADGRYMADQIEHNFSLGKSSLQLRKILRGY